MPPVTVKVTADYYAVFRCKDCQWTLTVYPQHNNPKHVCCPNPNCKGKDVVEIPQFFDLKKVA